MRQTWQMGRTERQHEYITKTATDSAATASAAAAAAAATTTTTTFTTTGFPDKTGTNETTNVETTSLHKP